MKMWPQPTGAEKDWTVGPSPGPGHSRDPVCRQPGCLSLQALSPIPGPPRLLGRKDMGQTWLRDGGSAGF